MYCGINWTILHVLSRFADVSDDLHAVFLPLIAKHPTRWYRFSHDPPMPILNWMDSNRRLSQLQNCEKINHPVLGWENNVFDFVCVSVCTTSENFDLSEKINKRMHACQSVNRFGDVKIECSNDVSESGNRLAKYLACWPYASLRSLSFWREINDLNVHRALAKVRFLDHSHCVTASNSRPIAQATNNDFAISVSRCDVLAMKV